MDTLLKILEPMIAQIEALILLAGVFLILHLVLKHRFKKKKRKIAELKRRIRAGLGWEDADLNKLKEFAGTTLDATVVTAAASGISVLEAYLGEGTPDRPLGDLFNDVLSGEIFEAEGAVSAAGDAISGADVAVSAGADAGVELAGQAAEGGALDVIANNTENFDATQNVPIVSAALFGIRTLRNVMRLAKSKQTGREAGINIGMDFMRIGVGGAGAMGLGKIGAAAGSALSPGAGTLIGSGVGIFTGSIFGSRLVNNARRTLKWGKIEKAQGYFGDKFLEGNTPEFAGNFTDEFFNTAALRERLLNEKQLLLGYGDQLDPYNPQEVTMGAVLSEEAVNYIETVLAKAEYVKLHLRDSMVSVCKTLTKNMAAKNAGVSEAGLAGELVLQAPQCLELTPGEKSMVDDYIRQKSVSKDYPCRFETDGTAVLETLSMELFNKYVPNLRKIHKEKKPVWLILFGCTMAALAGVLAYGLF